MDSQDEFLIGQAARAFKRTPSWLKLLERAGVIPPARRDLGGRRIYTAADVAEIRAIVERRAKERSAA